MAPRQSGSIVTIASLAGQVGGLQAGAGYAASKAGVAALTKSLARHAGPLGIRVNCVNPGFIDTAMTEDWPEEARDGVIGRTPLGRIGTPGGGRRGRRLARLRAGELRPRRASGRERRAAHGLSAAVALTTKHETTRGREEMAREAKICRGSWCLGFGFTVPASLEQVVKVLSAFGYDGIELAGFFDHATVERYPDKDSRRKLVDWIHSHDLELVGYAPGPYGDFGKYPWATGGDDALQGLPRPVRAERAVLRRLRDPGDARRPRRLRAAPA